MKSFIILSIFSDHEFGFPQSQIFNGCFSQRYHKDLILIWLRRKGTWNRVTHFTLASLGHWPVWILSQINNRPLCVPGTTRPLGFFFMYMLPNYNTNMDSRYLRLETTMVWFWFGNGTIMYMHCLFLLFFSDTETVTILVYFFQKLTSKHVQEPLLIVERTQIKENNLWTNQMVKKTNNMVLSMLN